MARGRFISRDVATSGKLADLGSDTGRMLWAFAMAFADRDGRVTGNYDELRATVVPRLGHVTTEILSLVVADLETQGLAERYTDAQGRAVIQFWNFAYQQKGMKYDREAPSKYGPNPDGSGLGPETSGGVRPKVKRKKKPKSNPKSKSNTPDEPADDTERIWTYFCAKRTKHYPTTHPLELDDKRRGHVAARIRAFGVDRVRGAVDTFFNPEYAWRKHGHKDWKIVFSSDERITKLEDAAPWGDSDDMKAAKQADADLTERVAERGREADFRRSREDDQRKAVPMPLDFMKSIGGGK